MQTLFAITFRLFCCTIRLSGQWIV